MLRLHFCNSSAKILHYLEMANKITAVVFDKTATLTEGKLCVSDIVCAENFNEDYVLQYAASIEKRSEHPIGQAICFKSNKKQIKTLFYPFS